MLICVSVTVTIADDLVDDSDLKLDFDHPTFSDSESSDPRLSFVTTSLFDWLRSIGFVNYNTYGYYITFPNKQTATNVYFNGTSTTSTTATAFPLSYTIAGAALVAYISFYLVSQIPLPALARSGDDLGFGLQRDLGDYEDDYFDDLEDVIEYEYPDSFYKAAASEIKPKKVKPSKKQSRKLSSRRSEEDSGGNKEPGFYDSYWHNKRLAHKRRRNLDNRRQYRNRNEENSFIGPQARPETKTSDNTGDGSSGSGSEFYKDRLTEAYSDYYDNNA